MRRKPMNLFILTLLFLGLSHLMTSCSKTEVIVSINKSTLTLEDFLYDIYQVKLERNTWNDSYKDILGVDYWDYEFEGNKMENLAKDTIMTRVILYEILYDQAIDAGFSLTDEDESMVATNADELINSMTKKQLEDSGLDYEILIKRFQKQLLGDKYYNTLLDSFKVNESAIRSNIEPNLYREYKTECLYVPTVIVGYQSLASMTDEKLDEAYTKILNTQELIHKGADFNKVLNEIDGLTYYERDFILDDNTAEEEYKKAAISLENGEYSPIVTTEFGHYIIHMLDNNSSYRLEKHIENTILNQKKDRFRIYYNELLNDYEITINNQYWDTLDLR